MESKKCFKCNEVKSIDEFYKHSMMRDGHLNKCKQCTRKDSTKNRHRNIKYIREYDRNRPNKKERNAANVKRLMSYRKKFPEKYKAVCAVNNAKRAGKIFAEKCYVCGRSQVEAHHRDYSKPLDVMWLCPVHHRAEHMRAKYKDWDGY